MNENLVRDFFELLIVVAVGGMTVSAILRMRRGQVEPFRCHSCDGLISRAYPRCPKCGAGDEQPA